jgi:hypothetical protein
MLLKIIKREYIAILISQSKMENELKLIYERTMQMQKGIPFSPQLVLI